MNPDHLFLGSRSDNNRDAKVKRRVANGERHGGHKLTDAQVDEVRARYAAGGITQRQLASEYGLCQQSISIITRHLRRAEATYPRLA